MSEIKQSTLLFRNIETAKQKWDSCSSNTLVFPTPKLSQNEFDHLERLDIVLEKGAMTFPPNTEVRSESVQNCSCMFTYTFVIGDVCVAQLSGDSSKDTHKFRCSNVDFIASATK